MSFDLLIGNARVVTCDGPADSPRARLGVIDAGAVAIEGERVAWVGPERELGVVRAKRSIDAGGRVVLPGLVDPHTHLVFAGSRVDEFARRMAGEDYRAIAAGGGGIAATVRWSREASDDELFALASARARAMRAHGVTSAEVKSGYGLSTEHELRHLRVARRLEGTLHVTTSLLGAHAVPPEQKSDRAAYVEEVATAMIPLAAEQGLADACDVYLDEGAFTRAEAERILAAAKKAGLKVRAHVGQFADLGGAELVAELGGLSCDHLEAISDRGLDAMARAGVSAVLLPGAWRTLRQTPPDVERMRARGVRIAVGTDCNPGTSPTVDLPLCAALAVRDAGLTLEEAVLAITAEAARAAGIEDAGRIAPGLRADLAIYDEEDPRALAYGLGGIQARAVVLGGRVVFERAASEPALW